MKQSLYIFVLILFLLPFKFSYGQSNRLSNYVSAIQENANKLLNLNNDVKKETEKLNAAIAKKNARYNILTQQINSLKAKKKKILDEMSQGFYCSTCRRAMSEFSGQAEFWAHIKAGAFEGRQAIPASESQKREKEKEFDDKIAEKQRELDAYDNQIKDSQDRIENYKFIAQSYKDAIKNAGAEWKIGGNILLTELKSKLNIDFEKILTHRKELADALFNLAKQGADLNKEYVEKFSKLTQDISAKFDNQIDINKNSITDKKSELASINERYNIELSSLDSKINIKKNELANEPDIEKQNLINNEINQFNLKYIEVSKEYIDKKSNTELEIGLLNTKNEYLLFEKDKQFNEGKVSLDQSIKGREEILKYSFDKKKSELDGHTAKVNEIYTNTESSLSELVVQGNQIEKVSKKVNVSFNFNMISNFNATEALNNLSQELNDQYIDERTNGWGDFLKLVNNLAEYSRYSSQPVKRMEKQKRNLEEYINDIQPAFIN